MKRGQNQTGTGFVGLCAAGEDVAGAAAKRLPDYHSSSSSLTSSPAPGRLEKGRR